VRRETVEVRRATAAGWSNAYRLYSEENIWPRGLPLDKVRAPLPDAGLANLPAATVCAPV